MSEGSRKLEDEIQNIPLADEDDGSQEDLNSTNTASSSLRDENRLSLRGFIHDRSIESLSSTFNGTDSPQNGIHSADSDLSPDEVEEKERLITQVLELQNTLDDLSQRVDGVKEENLKLKAENQVLGQYIENLMSASSVFQSTSPKSKKKGKK